MAYLVKTPWWLRRVFYQHLTWKMPVKNKPAVYITFDDGPHPTITPFVLDELKKHNAKATFFCIGNNVSRYKSTYDTTIAEGHTTGNHTYNHLNGWFTKTEHYLKNIKQAAQHIEGHIFRPPYGKVKRSQANRLMLQKPAWRIYMWDVLSGDFDTEITPEQCLANVLENIEPGSIVVFHDSEKAWSRMSYALPKVLEYCSQQGWEMKALPKH
ncbi:MAG: polysaccharide deacetylase family protein [Bacteroidetes bacterium]|nr:polysaccharide deacetylase family protein [Bacteroidota bacterium]